MTVFDNDQPIIPYSNPTAFDPKLLHFRRNELQKGELRAQLEPPGTEIIYLHIYNATLRTLRLQLSGILNNGESEILGPEVETSAIAYRQPFKVGQGRFQKLEVRFVLDSTGESFEDANLALAAYAGREPKSTGSLAYRKYDPCGRRNDEQPVGSMDQLPFDSKGGAVQRLILSSCDQETDLKEWVALTGLEVSEEYYGLKGSIVALGVPMGMSLDTAGGAAEEVRAHANTPGSTVTQDYLINLFNPQKPADGSGKQPQYDGQPDPTHCPPTNDDKPPTYDQNLDPVVVAIIDSGVDNSRVNRNRWEATRYRQRTETEFIRPWKLGFDFMDKDSEPEDVARHGTSVAATILSQYRSERPLNLVHLKTFGAGGISTYFGALVSIYEAAAIGVDVLNMSWGVYSKEPPPGLECAIKTAIECGVRIVTSAGNDGKDLGSEPQWPAAFASYPDYANHLITVASFGPDTPGAPDSLSDIHLSSYSNYGGSEVTLAAFMTFGVPEHGTGQTIYPLGTSISAPIVAGMLANWLADNPRGTVPEFCRTFCKQTRNLQNRTVAGRYIPVDSAQFSVTAPKVGISHRVDLS